MITSGCKRPLDRLAIKCLMSPRVRNQNNLGIIMRKCFVMQPFDKGEFDKRYDDVIAPAIREADLEPYRVDRDPSVNIPIDDIEAGIKNSVLCLAEITTDNPNVWFELGYAIAVPKDVILICSENRTSNFPFDVQHRRIIQYKTESPQDFQKLKSDITTRITATLKKQEEIGKVSKLSPIADTQGLNQHEIVALVTIMQNDFISTGGVSAWSIKQDMNSAGFTDIAVSIALRCLVQKEMTRTDIETDINGNESAIYFVTESGEQWLLNNQDKLVLKEEPPKHDGVPPLDEMPF